MIIVISHNGVTKVAENSLSWLVVELSMLLILLHGHLYNLPISLCSYWVVSPVKFRGSCKAGITWQVGEILL